MKDKEAVDKLSMKMLRDRLDDGELDLSMMQLREVPLKEIVGVSVLPHMLPFRRN